MNLASVSGLQQVYRDFSKSVGLQECPKALGGRIQKRILLAEIQQRPIVHEAFVTLASTPGIQPVCGRSGSSDESFFAEGYSVSAGRAGSFLVNIFSDH